MKYYEGLIKNTEFFTTAELAKKLKMNVQVITRKVQSGDISAYKIGKDWRIPEQSVYEWLESNSNRHTPDAVRKLAPQKTNIEQNQSHSKRLSGQKYLLEYILAQLEPGKNYTETEITRLITRHNTNSREVFEEFMSEAMLERSNGGFRRCRSYKLSR